MVSLRKQEKGNTKAINISKLMFGIKKTGNFLCDYHSDYKRIEQKTEQEKDPENFIAHFISPFSLFIQNKEPPSSFFESLVQGCREQGVGWERRILGQTLLQQLNMLPDFYTAVLAFEELRFTCSIYVIMTDSPCCTAETNTSL